MQQNAANTVTTVLASQLKELHAGQGELMQQISRVTIRKSGDAALRLKSLRDISALATQTAAVVAVLVATISFTSLLSPPSGWTTLDQHVRSHALI